MMKNRLFNIIKKIDFFIKSIFKMPKVIINIKAPNDKDNLKSISVYEHFTKPHRFKIIKNKTLGVALIDMHNYENFQSYYESINGKNSAAYYSRKAKKRGYIFAEINQNSYVDDIHEINISAPERQGRIMSSSYLEKQICFKQEENYRYFGVLNKSNKLVSYMNIGNYGDFYIINRLLGHKDFLNDGIMYLMIVEAIQIMFEGYVKGEGRFVMYDTFFGANEGLKLFKTKLGFKPYRVKWICQN